MKKQTTYIRIRIFLFISLMLLFAFLSIGIIFNIAARRYIQSSAVSQIDETYNKLLELMEREEAAVTELPDEEKSRFDERGNTFRIDANMFILDEAYHTSAEVELDEELSEIIQAIKDTGISVENIQNEPLSMKNGVYYLSAFCIDNEFEDENRYWIIYADVTGLSRFANSINFFLIILVCAMFFFDAIITFFLSSSITHPIHKLREFALKIGNGDFEPNDFSFRDKEFEDLNMTLNKSAKQLALYDNEQKAFFQNVSHELRTPLMSIQCYAEGISCGLMEPKEASETILQETFRLGELVKDLLYISKIDNITSSYTITEVDLLKTIRDCAKRQQVVADKNRVSLVFDLDETAAAYQCVNELMARAIDNLISNAIRYAAKEVILSCHKKEGQLEIAVADDGKGIAPEIMPHIFERFFKGADGNYGIGLAIVKSIIEQHNGSVKVANNMAGGATFTIVLPC